MNELKQALYHLKRNKLVFIDNNLEFDNYKVDGFIITMELKESKTLQNINE